MLYNKLSDAEINAIDYRINQCHNARSKSPITDTRYLLRFWNQSKENLFKLLNNSFIIEKPVKFSKSIDELIDEFCENCPKEINNAFRKITDYYYNLYSWDSNEIKKPEQYNSCHDIEHIISSHTLMENACFKHHNSVVKLVLPNDEEIMVQPGAKPMRVIKKLFAAMGFEDSLYEKLRLYQSQILNQKFLSGTLCLSIHPLDFMTMSDNNEDWSSCMSWDGDGCYRIGTVEMMNSPYVVVAYLKSDKNSYHIHSDFLWNSKKWRCLYIVDKDIITSIKGYPYYNPSLLAAAGEWLVELANKNLDGQFYNNKIAEYEYSRLDGIELDFSTSGMYNDFGCASHWGILRDGIKEEKYYIGICYSGATECMCCGEEFECESEGEGTLVCYECEGHYRCDECGCLINEEYSYSDPNGEGCYCEDCYSNLFVEDSLLGKLQYHDDVKEIYIIPNEIVLDTLKTSDGWHRYTSLNVCDKNYYASSLWDKYFTPEMELKEVKCDFGWYGNTRYYIYVNELTDAGWKTFFGSADRETYATSGRLEFEF